MYTMKRIALLAITLLLVGAGGLMAAPAQATEPAQPAPVVSLGTPVYSNAAFSVNASSAGTTSLKAKGGAKIVLNVSAKPIPMKDRGKCWREKVGKTISNTVVNPVTGKKSVIPWRIPKGDNLFCYKKGFGKRVFKASCDNEVWGTSRNPKKKAPKSMPRIKGRVVIQNYLSYTGSLSVSASQSGSASAYVVQYDTQGRKVCEARSGVEAKGYANVSGSVKVKARSAQAIRVEAARQARISANQKLTASGQLKGNVKIALEGKASAMCNYTPPTTPPPVVEPPVFIQFREFNDLEINWKDDHCVTVDTPAGHTATVYWEAKFGSFATPSKTAQDGVQICSIYKAPSEVPASGTDTITVRVVDNTTGKSVTKTTDPFVIHDTAPHPG